MNTAHVHVEQMWKKWSLPGLNREPFLSFTEYCLSRRWPGVCALFIIVGFWLWMGVLLSLDPTAESGHRWIHLSPKQIDESFQIGLILCVPILLVAIQNRRFGWVYPALYFGMSLTVVCTQNWYVGSYANSLAEWHRTLLYGAGDAGGPGASFFRIVTERAPLDWVLAGVWIGGGLGASSLSVVVLQVVAVMLSIPAFSRLLRLDFDERPWIRSIVLCSYAINSHWIPLVFSTGASCFIPFFLFSWLWSYRRCHWRRCWIYGVLLLSTGNPGALVLAGVGLWLAGRRVFIRGGIAIVLAVVWWTWFAPLDQVEDYISVQLAIDAFSEHDSVLFAYIIGLGCLPILVPEVLWFALPVILTAMVQTDHGMVWPGVFASLLLPIGFMAVVKALVLWIEHRMPGISLAAAFVLGASFIQAWIQWPPILQAVPVSIEEREMADSFRRIFCDPGIGLSADRWQVPPWYEEFAVNKRFVSTSLSMDATAEYAAISLQQPRLASISPEEIRQTLLAFHRDPAWGVIRRDGPVLVFQQGVPDQVELVLDEDLWDAQVVSVVFPREAEIGLSIEGRVKLKNTGQMAWNPERPLALGSWGEMDPFVGFRSARVPLHQPVEPGEEIEFVLSNLNPPDRPGDYVTRWRMVEEYVRWFGAIAEATVHVSAGSTKPQSDE